MGTKSITYHPIGQGDKLDVQRAHEQFLVCQYLQQQAVPEQDTVLNHEKKKLIYINFKHRY